MPAALRSPLDGSMTDSGELEQPASPCLGKVPRDLLQNFPHTKRVGSYLVGKMINKGSFAKVMLGMNISTGEKVTDSHTHTLIHGLTAVNQRQCHTLRASVIGALKGCHPFFMASRSLGFHSDSSLANLCHAPHS